MILLYAYIISKIARINKINCNMCDDNEILFHFFFFTIFYTSSMSYENVPPYNIAECGKSIVYHFELKEVFARKSYQKKTTFFF